MLVVYVCFTRPGGIRDDALDEVTKLRIAAACLQAPVLLFGAMFYWL